MGYEINIIKETGEPIKLKDWEKYVESDDDLSYLNSIEENTIQLPLENAVIFKAEGSIFLFSEEYNMISVSDPTQKTLDKMIRIASVLDAKVEGEEGEEYDRFSVINDYKDYEFSHVKQPKKWYEFWKSNTEKKLVFKKRKE